LGAGGSAFVRFGASVNLIDPIFTGATSATGGTGPNTFNNGQGIGQGLFLGGATTLTVSSGQTITLGGSDFVGGGNNGEAMGALTKDGPGTLVLSGNNSYAGGTTINNGTLRAANVSGSATGSGAVRVASSGTLSGTGTVAGAVTVQAGGAITPGNGVAPGMLPLQGGLTLQATSVFNVVAGNTTASALAITGALDVTGGSRTLTIFNDGSLTFGLPYTYTVATMSSTNGFTPTSFSVAAGNFPGFLGTPTVTNPGGTMLVVSFAPVPEPAHALLFCAAVGAVGWWRRRMMD
jgi:autotransporter-associated beta strand protein